MAAEETRDVEPTANDVLALVAAWLDRAADPTSGQQELTIRRTAFITSGSSVVGVKFDVTTTNVVARIKTEINRLIEPAPSGLVVPR